MTCYDVHTCNCSPPGIRVAVESAEILYNNLFIRLSIVLENER